MRRMLVGVVALVSMAAAPAHADKWTLRHKQDQFTGERRTSLMASLARQGSISFICGRAGQLEVTYSSDDASLRYAARRAPKLPIVVMLLVDDTPVRRFKGSLLGTDGLTTFVDLAPSEVRTVFSAASMAKARIGMAVEFGTTAAGQIILPVDNLPAALPAVTAACAKPTR